MTRKNQLNLQAEELLQQIDDLESRLDAARDDIETSRQLRALGMLSGAIAHEINNILTPVLSYARVALDSPDDTALSRKALEKAADGVERASRIASSVLSLANRQEYSGTEPPCCSPGAALEGALSCLSRPLEAEGIELRTSMDPSVNLRISLTDMEHVLLNLLLNAQRALCGMERGGGGVIEVRSRGATAADCSTWNRGGEPGGWAVLEFRDNGPGIEPELLPRVFEPFHRGAGRGENEPVREEKALGFRCRASQASGGGEVISQPRGHGLGLAICRQLVEAAGGEIRVGEGPGAVFVIVLGRG